MASQTPTPDLSQIVTRWGQASAPPAPRARSLQILAQLEGDVRAELGERAAPLLPLLPLLRVHAEALFPAGGEGHSGAGAEAEAEHLAALHLLLDRIEDSILALGLSAQGARPAQPALPEGPPWT